MLPFFRVYLDLIWYHIIWNIGIISYNKKSTLVIFQQQYMTGYVCQSWRIGMQLKIKQSCFWNILWLNQSKWVQLLWYIDQLFIIGRRRKRHIHIEITFKYIWFYHVKILKYPHVVSYVNDIFTYFLEKNSNMKYTFK